jgi:Fe-Mn family superoxide dismutase
MHTYTPQKFNISTLSGISQKQLDVHLALYEGYVKHVNLIREKIADLKQDEEKNSFLISELRRRFNFEFDGMRMHEYYFESFEGGKNEVDSSGTFLKGLSEKYTDWDGFLKHFKTVGMTRGIGWTILYYDPKGKTFHTVWVTDHELGQLAGLPIILAMDMWEHAFMVDYVPAEKKNYIESFLSNVNWKISEERFKKAM